MRHTVPFALATAAAALAAAAFAQSPAAGQDHAAHHPPGASAPASKAPAKPAPADKAEAAATMKSMREMHDRMMAARTPEERQALMAEHMKAMQGGMAMMGRMKGPRREGGASTSPEAMGMRMDMMEMMMQMMMDREAARTPAAK